MPRERTAEEMTALARHVRSARLAAGMSIEDAAAKAGISPVTWGRVEQARRVRGLTYVVIERALHWKPGSVDAIAAGEEPTTQADATARADTARPEAATAQPVAVTPDSGTSIAEVADVLLRIEVLLRRIGDPNTPDREKYLIIQTINALAERPAPEQEQRAAG